MRIHGAVFFRSLLKTKYFLLTAVLLGSGASLCAQQAGPRAGSATSRACSMNPVLMPSGKKGARKTKRALPPEPPPACIEVKGETLEIQEVLQAVVRDLQWRVRENYATEDSWSFVRYLNVDELENMRIPKC